MSDISGKSGDKNFLYSSSMDLSKIRSGISIKFDVSESRQKFIIHKFIYIAHNIKSYLI